jgi:transcriptional regulator with XRE-family HTH domain
MSRGSNIQPAQLASARQLLAINLIKHRARLGWSQEALAFEAGLHRTFIAHVERQARNISIDNIERIAVALGVKVCELLKPQTTAS